LHNLFVSADLLILLFNPFVNSLYLILKHYDVFPKPFILLLQLLNYLALAVQFKLKLSNFSHFFKILILLYFVMLIQIHCLPLYLLDVFFHYFCFFDTQIRKFLKMTYFLIRYQ